MCGIFDFQCHLQEWVITPTIDSTLQAFSQYAMNAFQASMVSYGAAWTQLPTIAFHNSEGASGFVFNHLHYWQVVAAIVATMFGGVKVALSRKAGEDFSQLVYMLFRMVIANGAVVLIVSTLATISDLTANGIIASVAVDGKLDFSPMFTVDPAKPIGVASSIIMFLVFGLIGLVVNMVQIGILLMRSAMLVLLTGFIPITASVSNLDWGRQWYNKSVAWLFAFLIYKPVAALIYGFGITMLGSPGENAFDTFTSMALGVIVLLMGVFALPALIKFLTPAVASMGGGGGGGGGMGLAMLAAGAMASRGGAGAASSAPATGSVSPGASGASFAPSAGGTHGGGGGNGGGGQVTPTQQPPSNPGGGGGGGGAPDPLSTTDVTATAAGATATAVSGGSTVAGQVAASGVQALSDGINNNMGDMPEGAQ